MRLILARHAQTDHNRAGLVQGREDHPLNAFGLAQAEAIAVHLQDTPLALVLSSPLQRARQTAAAVAARHGLGVEIDARLAELDVGRLEGLSSNEMRARYPELIAAWAAGEAVATPLPGGESLQQLQERAWAVVEELRGRDDSETVLVVTHNFVVLTLACRCLNLPLSGFRKLRQEVAALTSIDLRAGRIQVVQLNDTCHLSGLTDEAAKRR